MPLFDADEDKAIALAQEALDEYPKQYHRHWLSGMRAKLGLAEEQEGDQELIADLLRLMELHRADYTNTFRALTLGEYTGMTLFDASEFREWHERWQTRLSQESASREEAYERMRRHNPAVIPRNHRVEEALAAAVNGGDYSVMNRLLQALSDPYAYSPEQEKYAELPPPSDRPYRTFCGT